MDSLVLPFLGSRESDQQSFQYLIEDTSPHGARITLPNWVISRERLHIGEEINLHVPFLLDRETFDQGTVVWSKWEESLQAQVCGLRLKRASLPFQPIYFDISGNRFTLDLQHFKTQKGLVIRVIKDSYLLKKGVSIYLGHLIPYFSRVGDYPRKDFQALKTVFLADLQKQVLDHQKRLEQLFHQARQQELAGEENLASLDLEELRGISESELSMDLLEATFTSPLAIQQVTAIKTLEKRLYGNHNTLVMLYLRSLGDS